MKFSAEEKRILKKIEVSEFLESLDFVELIVIIKVMQGWQHKEIASLLEVSRSAVSKVVEKIKKQISLFG